MLIRFSAMECYNIKVGYKKVVLEKNKYFFSIPYKLKYLFDNFLLNHLIDKGCSHVRISIWTQEKIFLSAGHKNISSNGMS